LRLLIVDDVAHTGAEGEYLATLGAYDAVILDCLLPDKADGLSAATCAPRAARRPCFF
jgi:DNA-binding response OmpR family regulator